MGAGYKHHLDSIPPKLLSIIKKAKWEEVVLGCSGTKVFRLTGIHNEQNAYLKTHKGLIKNLYNEKKVLNWLKDQLPVPEVLYYQEVNGTEFLLITEIEGVPCSDIYCLLHPEETVKALAKGLRLVHSINITTCPFDETLSTKLEHASFRVNHNLVDINGFQPEYTNKTTQEIFQMAHDLKPFEEDLVFTHGDYCLPNIILQDFQVSGFIDFGRAGIGDRYQDIALAVRSCIRNFQTDCYIPLFLQEYGITNPDLSKITYYRLLDKLF